MAYFRILVTSLVTAIVFVGSNLAVYIVIIAPIRDSDTAIIMGAVAGAACGVLSALVGNYVWEITDRSY